jgi:Viral BACON domain
MAMRLRVLAPVLAIAALVVVPTAAAQSPALSVSPTSLAFAATTGEANPAPKTIAVTNSGAGTLNFTAADDAAWLSATPASGTAPQEVTVTLDATGLAGGTYRANVTITATGATGSPKVVPVTVTVTDPAEEKKARLRKRKVVKRVYRDYRQDGLISDCKHSRLALKRTLQSISDDFEADFPDFRSAVRAAIKDWDKDRCEEEEAEAEATPSPTPAPTSPAPTSTPFPTTTPSPPADSGSLPPFGGNDDDGGSSPPPSTTPSPPDEGDVAPVQPTTTPSPAPTPTAPPQAQLVVTRPGDDPSLLVPALMLAAALLGLAAAGGAAIYARRTGRLAGWTHSWREAGYRASGAWGDFSDWLRLGR